MNQTQQPIPQPAGWNGSSLPSLSEKTPASRYILGLVGALLGAVIGCIPWFIVSTFMNYFVGLLGFVVGIASFFGYKLLKGPKKTVYAFGTILLCSALCVLLSGVVSYYVMTMNLLADELNVSYSECMELLRVSGYTGPSFFMELLSTESEVLQEFVTNLALGLLFGGLGILCVRKPVTAYTMSGSAMPNAQGVPVQTGFDPNAAAAMPVQTPPMAYSQVQVPVNQVQGGFPPQAAAEQAEPVAQAMPAVSAEPVQQEPPRS